MSLSFTLAGEGEQEAFGRALAAALQPGLRLYLYGELGAGKTTLTRGIARGLGHEGAVKSPTYTLIEPYRDLRIPLYHFDLYRLGEVEELEFLGIRDYLTDDSVVVVEWPERGEGFLPQPDIALRITVLPGARQLQLDAGSAAGRRCLDQLAVGSLS